MESKDIINVKIAYYDYRLVRANNYDVHMLPIVINMAVYE